MSGQTIATLIQYTLMQDLVYIQRLNVAYGAWDERRLSASEACGIEYCCIKAL